LIRGVLFRHCEALVVEELIERFMECCLWLLCGVWIYCALQ
jgi:hypothetical protein